MTASERKPVISKGLKAHQELGRAGERLAAAHLARMGYSIVERNVYCRPGEIDLVAEHNNDIVFVEVKTRRGDAFGRPEEAVTIRKQRTLWQAAWRYLEARGWVERSWRIDIVAVQLNLRGVLQDIRVYQHAIGADEGML